MAGAPIVAAMIYAERMGANQARVLKYANSGDVTGDKSRVVGLRVLFQLVLNRGWDIAIKAEFRDVSVNT